MTCGGCARRVTKAIQSADPAAQIETDSASRQVLVTSGRSRAEFETVLAEAGYPASTTA